MQNLRLVLIIISFLPVKRFQQTIYEIQLLEILKPYKFEATWRSINQTTEQFDFFNEITQGKAKVKFSKEIFSPKHLILELYSTQYRENRNIMTEIPLQNYIEQDMVWFGKDSIKLVGQDHFLEKWVEECQSEYLIHVQFMDGQLDAQYANIQVIIQSKSNVYHCNFAIYLSAVLENKKDSTSQLTAYYLAILIMVIIQVVSNFYFSIQINKYQLILKKSFYFMIFWSFNLGIYFEIYFLNIFNNFQYEEYGDSIIVWFIYVYSIQFLQNFVQLLPHFPMLRQRIQTRVNSQEKTIWILILLYLCVFFLVLLIQWLIFYYLPFSLTFYMISHSFILFPELIYNFRFNTQPYFNFFFLYIEIFPELAFVIYLRGFSANIFSTQPNYLIFWLYVSIISLSFIVLLCQFLFGPRFQMYKEKIRCLLQKSWKCYICFNSERYTKGEFIYEKIYIPLETTLCNHQFHKPCFDKWKITKTLCPYCEAELQ